MDVFKRWLRPGKLAFNFFNNVATHYPSINKGLLVLLCILVVWTMPFSIAFHSASIGMLLIYSLFYLRNIRQSRFTQHITVLILPIVLFLIYFVNAFRAESLTEGFAQIEKRSPLLLFPIAFILIGHKLKEYDKDLIFRSFILLVIAISVICYVNAFINVIENKSFSVVDLTERNYYYFSYLYLVSPTKLDPIYMSLYSNLCLLLILFKDIIKSNFIRYLLLIYLSVYILLVSSKIGIIFLGLSLIIWIVFEVMKGKSLLWPSLIFFLIVIIPIFFTSLIRERFVQSFKYQYSLEFSGSWNSISQRLAIWNSAMEAISHKPILGYGTSNGQVELEKVYRKNGYVRGYEDHYNTHNEYMFITLESGVMGLLILLALLAYPIFLSVRAKSLFSVLFMLMIAFYFLVEVVLARQKGISMFAFFYCIILIKNTNE